MSDTAGQQHGILPASVATAEDGTCRMGGAAPLEIAVSTARWLTPAEAVEEAERAGDLGRGVGRSGGQHRHEDGEAVGRLA